MIRPLPLYIGLRYIRAKRRNRFISFISFASTVGIALGVAVLLTVLSVMNGFDQQIRSHFFAMAPQVTVSSTSDITDHWKALLEQFTRNPEIKNGAPFASGEGMLVKADLLRGVKVFGILPTEETQIAELAEHMVQGNPKELASGSFNIIITRSLAQQLNLQRGDTINVFTSQATTTPLGLFPRYRPFTVSGIYTNNSNSLQESVYIAMGDAIKLFAAGPYLTGLHLKLDNVYHAQQVRHWLQKNLSDEYTVSDWTIESGAFFQALALEKTMMFIILLLIIAIAAFNLVSMLMMLVNEKQADIAILRTLGATPSVIRNIFIIQGSILGILGTLVGLIVGIILTLNITAVVNALQQTFHVQFIPTSAFWSNYLPTHLLLKDIIVVCAISIGLSIAATLYPAWVAFRIQPAEALRYE